METEEDKLEKEIIRINNKISEDIEVYEIYDLINELSELMKKNKEMFIKVFFKIGDKIDISKLEMYSIDHRWREYIEDKKSYNGKS